MYKIGFPQVGNYQYPARFLFSNILNCEVIESPPITQKTIDLGVKYSPEFVCSPFKYTLGTLLEVIEKGANVVIQLGGGCRYGYYHELQEEIIKDLGYDILFINLVSAGHTDFLKIIKCLRQIDRNFSFINAIYYFNITIHMIKYMDCVDDYIRHNIGFERKKGSMEKLNKEMLECFMSSKSTFGLKKIYIKYFNLIKKVELNIPNKVIKVGVIGELYTVMEPFSNYFLERKLAKFNMSITRYTNAHYLLFKKGKYIKKKLKHYSKYVKYKMGADATDNIIRTVDMCNSNYDGIIHIKSSFCTPEISSMAIINKICKEYNVPVMFFSFDANTSALGLQTRLEAFYDMIEMRKK